MVQAWERKKGKESEVKDEDVTAGGVIRLPA
jgi:hypothetical protein